MRWTSVNFNGKPLLNDPAEASTSQFLTSVLFSTLGWAQDSVLLVREVARRVAPSKSQAESSAGTEETAGRQQVTGQGQPGLPSASRAGAKAPVGLGGPVLEPGAAGARARARAAHGRS